MDFNIDTSAFIELLGYERELFSTGELIVTRAPGRIDVMGGIADYSGSLVLPFPIAAATHAAIQLHNEPTIRVRSGSTESERTFEIPLERLAISYPEARELLDSWAAYVAGAFVVLRQEKQAVFNRGASIFIWSDVPEGKGVSSSAALEVASMQAIATAYDIKLEPLELALLCQRVENSIAGAPCGVMDQMTAVFGESDHLLSLLCQPAILNGTIRLPEDLRIWGIDSGIRHSVGGADYGSVRTAAFMGYRMIVEMAGEDRWNGYLANVTPEEFAQQFAERLPEQMSGEEFLKRYGGINDTVTTVSPERVYRIRAATMHPVYENARVRLFANSLHEPETMGELMYQSHESYSMCGLGSPGTDEIVRLVRETGTGGGLYGARITGGGCGGTVVVLGHKERAFASIARLFASRLVIYGSSSGAVASGHLKHRF